MGQQAPPPKAPPPQQPPPPPWQPHFDSNGGLLLQQQQQQQQQPQQQQLQLQHGQLYAQQNQGWFATHQQQQQQQQQPWQVEKSGQEEDWASKARAWASAKSAQDALHSVPTPLSAPVLTLDGGVQVPSSLQVPQDNPNGEPQGPYPYPTELPQRQQYIRHATVDASQQVFHGAPASWPSVSPGIAFPQAGSSQSPHMFSRPQGPYQPRGPFPFGGTPPIVPIVGVMDTSTERPRKTAVPTWLREELKKKAAAPPAISFPDGAIKRNGTELETAPLDGIPNSPGGSDTEVDDEEDVETVKTTIINQEIKRLLTEVLLKVTDGLFNEIAQEILNEELHGMKADSDKLRSSTAGPARVVIAAGDGQEAEINTTAAGNLLGLASYDSEDDTAEGDSENVNKIGREEEVLESSVKEDSEQDEENYKKRRPQDVLNSLEQSQAENHRNIENEVQRKEVVDEMEESNVDYDKERKKDKQRNKENEGDVKLKDKGSSRNEHRHRDIKDNRSERRRDRKKKHRPSLSRSRSPSSRRRSRSNSTDSPRRSFPNLRKLHERRRRSRSRSPRHHRRESPRSRSPSPHKVSPSPSRERRRHRHSRSRSPGHRPRKR